MRPNDSTEKPEQIEPMLPCPHTIRVRTCLVDASLVCFVILAICAVRCMFLVTDEMHQFRVDLLSQIIATRTAIQYQGNDINANLGKLAVSSRVLIDRLDTQMTHARTEITAAAVTAQKSTEKESKQIQKTISENLNDTTEAITTLADKEGFPEKPAVVIVPDAALIPAPAKTANQPDPAMPACCTTALHAPIRFPSDKKEHWWRHFFTRIFGKG